MENTKITIIGTGSWGIALAMSFHNAGKDVTLWGRRAEYTKELSALRCSAYLPNIAIASTLPITSDSSDIEESDIVLWVVPVQESLKQLHTLKAHIPKHCPIIICSKGLELNTQQPLSELFKSHLPNPIGILSGPNFADEIAKGLPAASTLAFEDLDLAKKISQILRHKSFRIYAHDDLVGIGLAAALKNVIAIAAGIVIGKELGKNCLAALITRATIEISRLICTFGGKKETMQTLAGIGDLLLTCSSAESRNTSLGIALAQGLALEDILNSRKSVTEGVPTTKVAFELAQLHKIHAPIICAVYEILYEKKSIDDVIFLLLSNQNDSEFE